MKTLKSHKQGTMFTAQLCFNSIYSWNLSTPKKCVDLPIVEAEGL